MIRGNVIRECRCVADKPVRLILALLFSGILPVCVFSAQGEQSSLDVDTYQRIVDENLALRRDKSRMEAEVGDLRQRNATLLLDVQELERKNNQLTALMSQLRTPEEMTAELNRLQVEKKALIIEVDRLRRALAVAQPPVTNPPPVVVPTPGSDLFRKIEQENVDLRASAEKTRGELQAEMTARQKLAESEAKLREEAATLSNQIKQLSSEAEMFKRKEAALQKAVTTQAKKAFEAEKRAEEAQSQKAKFEEQVAKNEAIRMQGGRVEESPKPSMTRSTTAMAVSTSQVVVVVDPKSAEMSIPVLLETARKLLAAKQPRKAEALYLKALKMEPKNPQVSYNLGILYSDYLKDTRRAAKYYRRYLDLAPNAPDAPAVRSWLIDLDARSNW